MCRMQNTFPEQSLNYYEHGAERPSHLTTRFDVRHAVFGLHHQYPIPIEPVKEGASKQDRLATRCCCYTAVSHSYSSHSSSCVKWETHASVVEQVLAVCSLLLSCSAGHSELSLRSAGYNNNNNIQSHILGGCDCLTFHRVLCLRVLRRTICRWCHAGM